ncbi:MAG TPA: twin-arginine translocase subunit TatC [Limnochordales bacterium]
MSQPPQESPWEQLAQYLRRSPLVHRFEAIRRYLGAALVVFVAAATAAFSLAPAVLQDMQRRMPGSDGLVMLAPAEGFLVRIKVALAMGAATAVPLVMLGVWAVATRGRPWGRRLVTFLAIPVSLGLFGIGAWFAYGWIVPAALRFLLGFAADRLEAMISVNSYVNFILSVVVPFGLVFQLPLLIFFLARLGVLHHRTLAERRGYAVVGIAALAAALTPGPDVFSQLLMAIPLVALYEVSIWVAWLATLRTRRQESDPAMRPS